VSNRHLTHSNPLFLNRLFVDLDECSEQNGELNVFLEACDVRAKHIKKILKLDIGDSIRIGVVDVGANDTSIIQNDNEHGITISLGHRSGLLLDEKPRVDLVLAVPRPLRLERLLPVVSSMGVGRIVLVGASKVEKSFFGSHLFRRPDELRTALIEGLSQAGVDCRLPEVLVRRDLKKFVLEEMDLLFPPSRVRRVVAHPLRAPDSEDVLFQSMRFADIPPLPLVSGLDLDLASCSGPDVEQEPSSPEMGSETGLERGSDGSSHRRIVVAVGPEGGWEDFELQLLARAGFLGVHLGPRVLRTDTAVTALLALANEWVAVALPSPTPRHGT